jgi:DNA polymerase I-like protein with 3'-5' exonuclease and polymerase domains
MVKYCERDTLLNKRVYDYLKLESKGFSPESVQLEQETARILNDQRDRGFLFDEKAASLLTAELTDKLNSVVDEVHKEFKPHTSYTTLYPTYTKSGAMSKMAEDLQTGKKSRLTPQEFETMQTNLSVVRSEVKKFNLGSRKQIGEYLQEFGWKPTRLTPTGQPIVDEGTLKRIRGIPQAKLIAEFLMLQKRIALISSWLDAQEKDGRVRGFVNPNGTITGRMTHRSPNMAQIPSVSSSYGAECRSCWVVPEGYKLLGIDASGLELRMLAHYMNDEEYINEILTGDIHSTNQKLAGLESRTQAKTFIYALIYGAGDKKLGTVVGGNRNDGRELRERFLTNLPALKELKDRVTRTSAKGFIKALDGRKLFIRSPHAALNTLLQGGGSIAMKRALIGLNNKIKADPNVDAGFVANIHDEWQIEVNEFHADMVGIWGVDSIREAGEYYKLNCPLDGEYKVGGSWNETH